VCNTISNSDIIILSVLIVQVICQNITVPNITTETYTKYNNIQNESRKSGDDFTQNENDKLKNSIDLCKKSDFADIMMNATLIIISSVFLQHILKLED